MTLKLWQFLVGVAAAAAIGYFYYPNEDKPVEPQKSSQTTCVAYDSGLKYCLEENTQREALGFKEFGFTGELNRCFYAPGHQDYCRNGASNAVAASADTIKVFQDTLKPAKELQARIGQDLADYFR